MRRIKAFAGNYPDDEMGDTQPDEILASRAAARLPRAGRRRRLLWRVSLLILVGWPLGAWAAAHALIVEADVARAEAIVVLSGSAVYVERTREAAQLFAAGRAPRIILTNDSQRGGWSSAEQRNPLFIERAAAELTGAGVPAEKIEMLHEIVTSTYEEALAVRNYTVARGARSLLIVTSAYHSRRAWWTWRQVFRGSGIKLGIHHVPAGSQTPTPATWWMSARGWHAVATEYPKLVYYWLRYF